MHFLAALALQVAAGYAYKKVREYLAPDREPPPPFSAPTATEGRKTPVAYGVVPIFSPNIYWWGDLGEHTYTDVSEGVAPVRTFWVGIQIGLCRGEVDAITNLWVDDKRFYRYRDDFFDPPVYDLIWDAENETHPVEVQLENTTIYTAHDGAYFAQVTAHLGSETQNADTYLDDFQNPCPGYRGRCYLTWQGRSRDMPPQTILVYGPYVRASGGVGPQTSLRRFAAEVKRIVKANPLGLAAAQRDVGTNGANANPMNVAMDVITNSLTLAEPLAAIDTANFTTAAFTLATEGNGISMLLDQERDLTEIIGEIERQINGFIFKSPDTGKWICKLARADYSVGSLTSVDDSNVVDLQTFRRTTWQGTVNQVNIEFPTFDAGTQTWRESTFARAHDLANFEIQGRYVPVDLQFPGLTDPALAAKLAARELEARNRPLAHAEILGKRALSVLKPGDVIRFNWPAPLNIIDLPMRVIKTDYGEDGGAVQLFLVEDVFGHYDAVQAAPPGTGWDFPEQDPVAVPLDEGQAQEIPYAIAARQVGDPLDFLDRIWVAAPVKTTDSEMKVFAREGAAPYAYEASSLGLTDPRWIRLGTLNADMAANTSQPHTTPGEDVTVNGLGYPSATSTITKTLSQLGDDLDHLVLVDGELMLARDIENTGTTWKLKRLYRGIMDTARRPHLANADVFLFVNGADLTITTADHTQSANTDVQFRPVASGGELAEADANTETVALAHRGRRPHPPTDLNIEGTRYPTSAVSLDSTTALGSGLDQVGIDVSWTRRDFLTLDQIDNAAGTLQGGFPSNQSTEYRIVTTEDPAGTPDVLTTGAWDATGAASQVVTRTSLLAENDGVVPTASAADLRVEVQTRHDFDGQTNIEALQHERWDFEVTSGLESLENTGARAQNVTSAPFTASVTGSYDFTTGTSVLTAGVIEANINGGSFTTVIATGNTTGTLAGVTSGDLVRWRSTEATNGNDTHLRIQQTTGSVDEAYGIVRA